MLISLKDTWASFVTCKPNAGNSFSTQPKTRLISLGPGAVWAGMELTQCYFASCVREGAVLGRAPEFCSSATLGQAALAASLSAYLPSCLPSCELLASWKVFASFSANPQAPYQVILILCVLYKHTYDMLICVHMLVGARVQRLVASSVTNPFLFFFVCFLCFVLFWNSLLEPQGSSPLYLLWAWVGGVCFIPRFSFLPAERSP